MKIIVCAKQIRHTYARTGTSPESHYIRPEDGVYRVNPHDEAALELALRLKDAYENTTVVLLTLEPMIAEEEIRRCMATGADDLYQINVTGHPPYAADPLDQPDPWAKSDLMARAVKDLKGDLVLCGKASLDKGSGQVGALLAHRLDLPFVSAITDLTITDFSMNKSDGTLQVQRSAGRGVREIIECRLLAVFSVDLGRDSPAAQICQATMGRGLCPPAIGLRRRRRCSQNGLRPSVSAAPAPEDRPRAGQPPAGLRTHHAASQWQQSGEKRRDADRQA